MVEKYILILSFLGILMSIYSYSVNRKLIRNPFAKVLCDFSEKVSCSKAFRNRKGNILGVSNTILGIFFYSAVFLSFLFGFFIWGGIIIYSGAVASVYLLWQLLFKLRIYCAVCILTHLINLALFLAAIL